MAIEHKAHHKKIKPVIEEIVDDGPKSSIEENLPITADISEQPLPENLPTEVAPATEVAPTEEQSSTDTGHIDHPVHTYPTNDENVNLEREKIEEKPANEGFHISIGFIFITLAVAAFVAILSGALYVYFNGVNSLKMVSSSPTPIPVATPSTTETPTPAASATPLPDLDTYKVSVLNGSGKSGVASAGQKVMEDAGFDVTRATNAANFDFETTVIQAKATVPASVIAAATAALDKNYEVEVGTKLEANNAYDIIVTIGAK